MLEKIKNEVLGNILLKLSEACQVNSQIINDAINSNSKEDITTTEKLENLVKLMKLTDFQIEFLTKIKQEALDNFNKN